MCIPDLWCGRMGASVACCTTTRGSFLILFSRLCCHQALYTRNPVPSLRNPLYFLPVTTAEDWRTREESGIVMGRKYVQTLQFAC